MSGLIERAYSSLLWHASAHRGVRWMLPSGDVLRIDPRCRWIRHAGYEAPVVEYLRSRMRADQTCIDAGAHVGFYALQMALWTRPTGRVVAFEPNPTARDLLKRNVALNGLSSRVAVEAAAVGAAAGRATLYDASNTSGLSRLGSPNPASRGDAARADVAVIALDEYCRAHAFAPDWVLIDVEGAEIDALRGAERLLATRSIGFVVEVHEDLWSSFGGSRDQFTQLVAASGRSILPLTGQADPLAQYGTVALI
jgi:FkbM family methyltransferase